MTIKHYILMMLATAVILASCNTKNESADNEKPPLPVQTQKVQLLKTNKQLKVSGNIEGNKTVRLGFLVAGKINFIAVHEGAKINKGELLASLDPESYEIAVEIANANLAQMQDDYNRIKELHDKGSVTESDFVKITNGLRIAKAQQSLQAKNLSDTKLYVPFSGVLLKRGVEEGEIIDKGTQIFGVSDIYKVKVIASIPEMELRFVKLGAEAKVYVPSLDSIFTGKTIEIGTLAEPTTRSFNVKIELNNPNLTIRPGMTAEVIIETGNSEQLLSLPAHAILHELNNAAYVYVADTLKYQAFKRIVSLGKIVGDNIEIVSGLSQEDHVIVSGQYKLTNGASISIKQ